MQTGLGSAADDADVADLTDLQAFDGYSSAGGAGNGDEINETPGCNDAECCTEICEIDPYCCVVVWDIVCRNKALSGDYPGCND